jgi:hypothetical protein
MKPVFPEQDADYCFELEQIGFVECRWDRVSLAGELAAAPFPGRGAASDDSGRIYSDRTLSEGSRAPWRTRVNDDFRASRFVEDAIWIGRRRDAPNGKVIGQRAGQRITQEQVSDRTNSGVDVRGASRRAIGDVTRIDARSAIAGSM